MKVNENTLYVFTLPEDHRHRFVVGRKDDPIAKEGAKIVAGPFGVMNLRNEPITDNGWDAANTWIRLNDRVAWNFLLNNDYIWDQIETIVDGCSFFDDMRTSWHRWIVIKWPETLPEHYVHNPNELFTEELLSRFGLTKVHATHAGQPFADIGHIEVDRNRQLIHMTQMGGLDI
jgi:hypothetical protein